jgi:hypothetical protein
MRLNSSSPMVPSVRPYLMREAIVCNQHALELEQAQTAISMRPYVPIWQSYAMREAIMRNQAISMRPYVPRRLRASSMIVSLVKAVRLVKPLRLRGWVASAEFELPDAPETAPLP